MTEIDQLTNLLNRLDTAAPRLSRLDRYFSGRQPAAFLSDTAKKELNGRLASLGANLPRLACTTLANRLALTAFKRDGDQLDPSAWRRWRRAGGDAAADGIHLDALVAGTAFALIWAAPNGRPTLSAESARSMAVDTDPATGEVLASVKSYAGADGKRAAVVLTPDGGTRWTGPSTPGIPATAASWTRVETFDNPFNEVPVVPFVNRSRIDEVNGTSEIDDLAGLTDAVAKLLQDQQVSSELTAMPRRWITGLSIPLDAEGNRTNPVRGLARDNALVLTSSDARAGQWDGAPISGYSEAVRSLLTLVGAVSGLPAHLLGLLGDQPASADALAASEVGLVERAVQRQRSWSAPWGRVAALLQAAETGESAADLDLTPVWADPASRSRAADADAVVKLVSSGVGLGAALSNAAGWSPEQIASALSSVPTNAGASTATPGALPALPNAAGAAPTAANIPVAGNPNTPTGTPTTTPERFAA